MKQYLVIITILAIMVSGCTPSTTTVTNDSVAPLSDDSTSIERTDIEETDTADVSELHSMDEKLEFITSFHPDINAFYERIIWRHPKLFEQSEKDAFIEYLYLKLQDLDKNFTKKELFFFLSEVSTYFEDGHFFVRYREDIEEFLDLAFDWNESGLYVRSKDIPAGSKLISLGGMTAEDIFNNSKKYFSSENDYWIKYRVAGWVRYRLYLEQFGALVTNNNVEIEYEYRGEKFENSLPFVTESSLERTKKSTYAIEHYDAFSIFKLNRCVYDEEYRDYVKTFFNEVQERGTNNIILDLRQNPGGNSNVIGEFIKYLDVDSYKDFYRQMSFKREPPIVNNVAGKVELPYKGDLYVATSYKTFSSAALFTGVLKYNDIAKTIGEPTGNATKRYGYTERVILPETKINVSYSNTLWVLPTETHQDSIYPDIPLSRTIEHWINGTDEVVQWAEKNLRK